MILYAENYRIHTHTHTQTVKTNRFSKAARCKINAQKSLGLLYTSNERSEKEIKTIPFTIAIQE